ncbi:hypothetical protein B0F90DRAFT_1818304 [Multifurca ochricompacta]|uniref:TauD/TfdA-like domain-containing protein n=1 Tax=Multifurca ochricompacta TaxID=376703 RepID=A0AAD4M2N0_9AGAM|nr:hypothetical protein B0F90DRAFT_1818304 [Multifurca ochricompacta]
MAPSLIETVSQTTESVTSGVASLKLKLDEKQAVKADKGPSYPLYFPHYDDSEKFPPTEIFEFSDPGLRADPRLPHLLAEGVKRSDLSPYIGTELRDVQLSQLNKEGLDEDISRERQIEIARHFGPIQVHPTSGNVKGFPEFHVVYRDAENDHFREYIGGNRANLTSWHSDVSYEKQPPGTTLFWILDQPELGGDTIFASQVEAYNRLSPEFQKRLEGLRAVHTAVPQAEHSALAVDLCDHPVVRQHPVTGEKALYVNQGFTKHIVGFKTEESEFLLKFLFDHIAKGADFQ